MRKKSKVEPLKGLNLAKKAGVKNYEEMVLNVWKALFAELIMAKNNMDKESWNIFRNQLIVMLDANLDLSEYDKRIYGGTKEKERKLLEAREEAKIDGIKS